MGYSARGVEYVCSCRGCSCSGRVHACPGDRGAGLATPTVANLRAPTSSSSFTLHHESSLHAAEEAKLRVRLQPRTNRSTPAHLGCGLQHSPARASTRQLHARTVPHDKYHDKYHDKQHSETDAVLPAWVWRRCESSDVPAGQAIDLSHLRRSSSHGVAH